MNSVLRRASVAPVDDRLAYPPLLSEAPAEYGSFHTPEGDYNLVYEVGPLPPSTPLSPQIASQAGTQPSPIPDHPAHLTTAVLYFPGSAPSQYHHASNGNTSILGLGGQQRSNTSRNRDASTSHDGYAGGHQAGASSSSNAEEASSTASGSSYSPLDSNLPIQPQPSSGQRKRPLVSLPSLSTVPISMSTNSPISANPTSSKPKSAFRGTTSNFVKMYEGLPISAKADKLWGGADAREVILAIFTSTKGVHIMDISPRAKSRDPIARIAFSATPTCAAVNNATLTHERLDILVGFNTGDIIWMEVFSGRYTRYNKDAQAAATNPNKPSGCVCAAAIKRVAWLPGAGQGENMFCCASQDGSMSFWDRDREDPASFAPYPGLAPANTPLASMPTQDAPLQRSDSIDSEEGMASGFHMNGDKVPPSSTKSRFSISYKPTEYTDDIVVTLPQASADKKNPARFNPVAHWKVSRKGITDFAVSPDNQFVAVVSEDGCLRIIDANTQRLLDTFQAYFGALTCVTWSPDGRFILTGGQDDLACIWSPFEQRIVARCEGHSSFLTGLAFDPWRCDSRTQRFASVSEDCRLIFWDLSSAALQRPKGHLHHLHHAQSTHQQQGREAGPYARRASAMSSLSLSRRRTIESSVNLPATATSDREGPVWHRAPNRSEVPGLQPVVSKTVSQDLLSGVAFLPNMVVTISRSATVRVFSRPEGRF